KTKQQKKPTREGNKRCPGANKKENITDRKRQSGTANTKGEMFLDLLDKIVQPDLEMVHLEDITERKRAEEELRESEMCYRSLFENAPVGVFYSTADGKIIRVNAEYA